MPDEAGKLSDAEKKTVQQNIRLGACPMCGERKWELVDSVVSPTNVGQGGGIIMGGQIMPQVMVVSPCGFIASFAAIKAGIKF